MEKLGIDPKILVAQLINFGLFTFIFVKFIAGPFLKIIENEKKKDQERALLAERVTKQEAELANLEKEAKEKIRKDMDAAVAQVRKETAELKKELMHQAQQEAHDIVENAQASMKETKLQFERELKDKLTTMSVLIVKNALKAYLDENMQKSVTDRILKELSNPQAN